MEKPRIVKVMEKVTGLNYYELYNTIKIKSWDLITFTDKIDCECGKKDLKYVSEIEINGTEYYVGCVCIKKIYDFLKNELIICKDEMIRDKINECVNKTSIVLEEFEKAVNKYKKNNDKFKKLLDNTLKNYGKKLDELEKNYHNNLEILFNQEKAKIMDNTFKCGKYKGKKFYEIDDAGYFMWIITQVEKCKQSGMEESDNFHKFFNKNLINNIISYLKKKHCFKK